jgi:quercetin dioxygenase-like cupin family protein
MARTGEIIESAPTGERIRFLRTSDETAGTLLELDLSLRPHGAVAGAHVHPNQEERFEVTSGTLRVRTGRRWRTVHPGDVVIVPPGTPHLIRNDTAAEGSVTVGFRPALRTDELLTQAFAIMNTHGLRPTPRFVAEFCTLLVKFREEMRTPWRFVDALVTIVAQVARRVGFRPAATGS